MASVSSELLEHHRQYRFRQQLYPTFVASGIPSSENCRTNSQNCHAPFNPISQVQRWPPSVPLLFSCLLVLSQGRLPQRLLVLVYITDLRSCAWECGYPIYNQTLYSVLFVVADNINTAVPSQLCITIRNIISAILLILPRRR